MNALGDCQPRDAQLDGLIRMYVLDGRRFKLGGGIRRQNLHNRYTEALRVRKVEMQRGLNGESTEPPRAEVPWYTHVHWRECDRTT